MSKFANLSDRQFCTQVSAEALEILQTMLPDDVVVKRGNATYTEGSFSLKFTFAKVGEDGAAMTPERQAFIDRIEWREGGLTAADIDAEFRSGGRTFRIVGLKTRARKRPILCQCVEDGKQYVFPVSNVARALGRGTV